MRRTDRASINYYAVPTEVSRAGCRERVGSHCESGPCLIKPETNRGAVPFGVGPIISRRRMSCVLQRAAKPMLLFGIGDTVRPMIGVLVLEAAERDGKRVVYARRVGITCMVLFHD